MDIFSVLTLIGGLAMFLFGMTVMSDNLAKASGGKLSQILENLTSNRIKAVLLGAGVTAVIQSSSATTVMVVGFVNSGIMKLSQAIGIIMGANIGTTITAWLLSLTGIQGDSLFIKLLKPSSFSPILAAIGIVILMFSKNEKKRDIGNILLGFAVLMFGMETMSSAVEPLADVPEFTNILTMFSNPLLGVLAGAALTAVIQSSSASVGILQALCVTGAISYATAVPVILGQNIGTCVTAIISAIGAHKNAKRTALVHLYFNIVGTIVFMILFYGLNHFLSFAFLGEQASAAGIAVVHSGFNIFATLLLLPFANQLEKLACMTLKDTPEDLAEAAKVSDLELLDKRFLETPGYAIAQCRKIAIHMASMVQEAHITAASLLTEKYDTEKVEAVRKLEEHVDVYEDKLGTYLVEISKNDLTLEQSQVLTMLLRTIGDFERICDHAVNLMESAIEMNEKKISFSGTAQEELKIFTSAVKEIIDLAVESFDEEDVQKARKIEPLEEVVDIIKDEMNQRHIDRLKAGSCTIELGFILSDVTTDLERVADHCSNIGICVIQEHQKSKDVHRYVAMLKETDSEGYRNAVYQYAEKYMLPSANA